MLIKNKILLKHQFGFRKDKSTELAVVELVDKITKAIDKGEYTIGIFFDLSKSFDTINRKILCFSRINLNLEYLECFGF